MKKKEKKKYGLKDLIGIFCAFFRVGALTFGGGIAMFPMLKRECVDNKGWVTDEEITDYFAIGQCTPGVIAVNTATFVGFKLYGWIGALFATLGVISPSIIIITIVASILKPFMGNEYVLHAFNGIRIAVCAMLIGSCVMLFKKNVKEMFGSIVFLIGAAICFFAKVPIVILVILSAIAGIAFFLNRGKGKEE